VLVASVLLHQWTTLRVTGAAVRRLDAPWAPVTLPHYENSRRNTTFEFAFDVHVGPLTQPSVIIVPDDRFVSLSVNGKDVSLRGISREQREDYENGFRLSLAGYLRRGENHVVARVLNQGGRGGLDVRPDPRDWRNVAELMAAVAALFVIAATALRSLKLGWPVIVTCLASLIVRFAYLAVTGFKTRDHDVNGHIQYVEYILNNHTIPRAREGSLFYHPPLYYLASAAEWKLLSLASLSRESILLGLQLQSMLYELGFVAFAAATAKLFLDRLPDECFGSRFSSRGALFTLFLALALVWPSSIIHSVRIGNDDLFYLTFGGGLYFASRWWLLGENRDLNLAALCAAFGMVTKTNSLLMFAVLGVLFIGRVALVERERSLGVYVKRSWPTATLLVVSTALALGGAALDSIRGHRDSFLVGNAHTQPGGLAVGNRAENYLWFDVRTFVNRAFTDPWNDEGGRQLFWNYTFKTGLFGEFRFEHPWLWNLAVVLSVLFLVLLAFVVVGAFLSKASEWLDELPLVLTAGALVAGLMLLRMSVPLSCSNDFRYILPVLAPFLYGVVRSLTLLRRRGWTGLAALGTVTGWLFAALSSAFFLILAVSELRR
jgi:hypothetical protein